MVENNINQNALLIESDPEPEPTNTEVLDNAFTWTGESFKDAVMNQLVQNDIKLLVPFGPPRAGKSTISHQLGSAIELASEGAKTPVYKPFDDLLQAYQRKIRTPIAIWGPVQWKGFSYFSYSSIEETLMDLDDEQVVIAEMMSIGKTDRGRTTLDLLSKSHPIDAFFFPLIGDPEIEERDAIRRIAALEKDKDGNWMIPDEELINYYSGFGLIISGWENMSITQAGRTLREAIGRMDRPIGHKIWSLRNQSEVEEIALRFTENGLPQGLHRLTELDELLISVREQRSRGEGRYHPVPKQLRDVVLDPWRKDRLGSLLQYYWVLEQSGAFKKDRFVPAINLLIEDKPIHYLDLSKIKTEESEEAL